MLSKPRHCNLLCAGRNGGPTKISAGALFETHSCAAETRSVSPSQVWCAIIGWLLPVLAPVFAITVAFPVLDVGRLARNELNQAYPCLNNTHPNTYATCDAGQVFADLYFWNLTNPLAFLAGTQPPALQEVGPFVFRVHRVVYNVAFNANWYRVNTSSHQWSEFDEAATAAACDALQDNASMRCPALGDPLTLVNRYIHCGSLIQPPQCRLFAARANKGFPCERICVYTLLLSMLLLLHRTFLVGTLINTQRVSRCPRPHSLPPAHP